MELTKYKLGDLIQRCSGGNEKGCYGADDVRGISINKSFIPTKANLEGVSLTNYTVVEPGDFSFVTVTSRNGEKLSIAYNDGNDSFIVSSFYVTFRLNEYGQTVLDNKYLFMYFNRSEFDRYVRRDSWGAAREYFYYENICNVEIELPSLAVQKKYVNIYNAMLANQQGYEKGLEDLRYVCDAYIDKLKGDASYERLGDHISLCDSRNENLEYGLEAVRGVSIDKRFIDTKANMEGVSLRPYAIIRPNEFAYVTVTSRNGEKISIARNDSEDTYICSSSYVVFRVNSEELMPAYLSILFERNEFNRYARFHSWGSARETFDWDEMKDVRIPIPSIEIQQAIVNIYESYRSRMEISERLKVQIKDVCPILIKGSIEEAAKEA